MKRLARCLVLLGVLLTSAAVGRADDDAKAAVAELEKLGKAYGIWIVPKDGPMSVDTSSGTSRGEALKSAELPAYAKLVSRELNLYPKALVAKSGLKRITLCEKLAIEDQPLAGYADPERRAVYLDMSEISKDADYMRRAIHHEFFHVFDEQCDRADGDERWASFNYRGFEYISFTRPLKGTTERTERYIGFLNHYSTTHIREDKAEVFANLLFDLAYMKKRTEQDRIIRAKVQRMQELLKKQCPEMDEKFWTNLAEWQKKNR